VSRSEQRAACVGNHGVVLANSVLMTAFVYIRGLQVVRITSLMLLAGPNEAFAIFDSLGLEMAVASPPFAFLSVVYSWRLIGSSGADAGRHGSATRLGPLSFFEPLKTPRQLQL